MVVPCPPPVVEAWNGNGLHPGYDGTPVVPFGEIFGFTGYIKQTVNGTPLELGGIKKCARLIQPEERTAPGPYTRSISANEVTPGACD